MCKTGLEGEGLGGRGKEGVVRRAWEGSQDRSPQSSSAGDRRWPGRPGSPSSVCLLMLSFEFHPSVCSSASTSGERNCCLGCLGFPHLASADAEKVK